MRLSLSLRLTLILTLTLPLTLTQVRDWFDWMLPEAWNVEHNNLHHYRTGEPGDPDLVERNLEVRHPRPRPRARLLVPSPSPSRSRSLSPSLPATLGLSSTQLPTQVWA